MLLRPKLYLVVAIIGIIGLLAGACAKSAPESIPPGDFEDTKWTLESYGEPGNLQAVLEGSKITATFDSAEGRVHGSAGCNNYFGRYQVSDNKLSILETANTEMYCMEPEGVMEQELQYLKALQAAESFQIQDGKLQINSGNQVLVFSELP